MNYEKMEKLREGICWKVYKARDKRTGLLVTLKKIRLEMEDEGAPSIVLEEVFLLEKILKSMYIVSLICVEFIDKKRKPVLYLVSEYIEMHLNMYMHWNNLVFNNRLAAKTIQRFMYQLLKGVYHCHSHGVLHRNLEPQNLLVDRDKGILKIDYVWLGRSFPFALKSYSDETPSIWYRAPEILLGSTQESTGADIWSAGCIFVELVSNLPLFEGISETQQLVHIFSVRGTPKEEDWPGVTRLPKWRDYVHFEPQEIAHFVRGLCPRGVNLLEKMMVCNPLKRISAKEALYHPYFNDLDKLQFG